MDSGRRFDESTLPPRTRSARLRRKQTSPLQAKDRQLSSEKTRRSASPSKAVLVNQIHGENHSRANTIDRLSPPDEEQVVKHAEGADIEGRRTRGRPPTQPPLQETDPAAEARLLSPVTDGMGNNASILEEPQTEVRQLDENSLENGQVSRDTGRTPQSSDDVVQQEIVPQGDGTVIGRSKRNAVSPVTSPADGSQDEARPASKSVDIPRQPDTPDSTQRLPSDDPSPMDIDTAVKEMTGPDPSSTGQPTATNVTTDSESQRPSVRVNTNGDHYFAKHLVDQAMVESPVPITGTAATPRKAQPPTPSALQDSSKRATRISSGVLQKKSVSEILNEAQRSSSDSPASESREQGNVPKDRSRLSTVVFAKPQKNDTEDAIRIDANAAGSSVERDYLYTLFENKAHSMSRNGSMTYLINNAHKALSTADHLVDWEHQSHCRILKRVYQLQERGRWALRQLKRSEEPARSTSHWDMLLDHAKWMRADFREERRWKMTIARGLAEECADWVNGTSEERQSMQVNVRPPKMLEARDSGVEDVPMEDDSGPALSSHPTPDLIPSNEDDSMSETVPDPTDINMTVSPAAIFGLGASECTFHAAKTQALDKVLNELPLYEPAPIVPDLSKSDLGAKLDARWRTDVIPVSKYAYEKLNVKEDIRPTKRSRYEYDLEMSPTRKTKPLSPREKNVALFNPENKHIRDRIHPGHAFRPPSGDPMPTQEFFQTRSSSQWTTAEDDELKKLVKDYSYNFSLISSCLTTRSLYVAGPDRRTPWECFERWIGLEGLPADMAKTTYFRTYSGRIEAAGKHVQAQIEELQRKAPNNPPVPPRKKTTQPVRVERKRNQRHLAMLDAMRKLYRKRENAAQKQQHNAEMSAIRKASSTEVNRPQVPFTRPAQFAQLRHERDQKRAEQQEMYKAQLMAHQRAAQQRGNLGANGLPNGMPMAPNGMRGASGGVPGMPNGANMQVPNGGRPHPSMIAAMNGMQMPPGMMGSNNKQVQMQMQMAAAAARGMPTSPEQVRMMQQAAKLQQQQHALAMQNQQTNGGQQSSPNGVTASLANGNMLNGAASPSTNVNGVGATSQTSPRSGQQATGPLSSGHIPAVTQIANKLPIGAMNAGAHASNNAMGNPGFPQGQSMPQLTPEQIQQYQAQRMRVLAAQQAQQQQQANGAAPRQAQQGMNMGLQAPAMMNAQQGGMPAGSPVMNMARPVSQGQLSAATAQQQQMSRSVTPSGHTARSGSIGAVPGGMGSPAQVPGQMATRPTSSRGQQQNLAVPGPQQMTSPSLGVAGPATPQMQQQSMVPQVAQAGGDGGS
ncbi:Chromatin modification-related protein eaf1 [Cyphellophora attinorum]|uniref:Vacuolar import and degradation protein 21 n=1 Tax=Cyphellophora attinorum TaxID=1664694 RepID=A0A0N1P2W3_9EURO|nr:Chromatin modification-related protein eaf1 [Phialophora attinorum]KPI46012.1 Chromatin modification-related protein eaf1 [Phialophora attinorum]